MEVALEKSTGKTFGDVKKWHQKNKGKNANESVEKIVNWLAKEKE